jgi:hypothetical protein
MSSAMQGLRTGIKVLTRNPSPSLERGLHVGARGMARFLGGGSPLLAVATGTVSRRQERRGDAGLKEGGGERWLRRTETG